MAVRIVDVDVSEVNRSIDAETLQRISGIEDHYGHAGPLFVQKLVEHGLHRQIDALRDRVASASRHLAGDAADGATVRAATPFALLLIAGELAKGFGLIPATTAVEDAVIWAWGRFQVVGQPSPRSLRSRNCEYPRMDRRAMGRNGQADKGLWRREQPRGPRLVRRSGRLHPERSYP
jgi:hypothetical protein